jgi:hypothetical protein
MSLSPGPRALIAEEVYFELLPGLFFLKLFWSFLLGKQPGHTASVEVSSVFFIS